MGLFLPPAVAAQRQRQQRAREVQKITSDLIQKHYPEHLFMVEVDPKDGNIFIDHPLLAHAKARYFLPFSEWDFGRGAIRLCGEILERANVSRSELKHYETYDEADPLARTQFNAR